MSSTVQRSSLREQQVKDHEGNAVHKLRPEWVPSCSSALICGVWVELPGERTSHETGAIQPPQGPMTAQTPTP